MNRNLAIKVFFKCMNARNENQKPKSKPIWTCIAHRKFLKDLLHIANTKATTRCTHFILSKKSLKKKKTEKTTELQSKQLLYIQLNRINLYTYLMHVFIQSSTIEYFSLLVVMKPCKIPCFKTRK